MRNTAAPPHTARPNERIAGRVLGRRRLLRRSALLVGLVAAPAGYAMVGCDTDSIRGFLAAKAPDGDTAYDIGSVTKQFTAAAVLAFEREGELSVSDPLAAYVDGLEPDKRGITLAERLFRPAAMEWTGHVLPRWSREQVAVQ